MVLNAYGSAILKSEMDFSIWAMKKGIKNPVEKKIESEKEGETAKYNKLIEEGFEVHVSPFIHSFNGEPSKNSTIVSKEKADLKQKRIIK